MPTTTSEGSSACTATISCSWATPWTPSGIRSLASTFPSESHHAHVVMRFRPVDPDEDHAPSSRLGLEPGGVRGALMDQCSDGTTSHQPSAPPPGGGTI